MPPRKTAPVGHLRDADPNNGFCRVCQQPPGYCTGSNETFGLKPSGLTAADLDAVAGRLYDPGDPRLAPMDDVSARFGKIRSRLRDITDDDLAALDGMAADSAPSPNGQAPADDALAWAHIIDWDDAFGAKPAEVQWLIEPLLERGTLNAWFGKPAAWKSLIALEASAALAAGRPVLGAPAADPVTVLYVDVENAVNDIVERLQAFGYGPGDLKRLVYSSFPDVPALDTPVGPAAARARRGA
jgi:hypothetical protein